MLALDRRDLDDRDVDGAAAQVIDRYLAVAFLLVEPEGERRRGGLVDDALHFKARDAAGVLGRLALRVVEVRRHRDDGLGDRLAEIVLGGLLHLAQDLRGDLLRRDLLAANFDPGVAVIGLPDLLGHDSYVLLDFALLQLAPDEAVLRATR